MTGMPRKKLLQNEKIEVSNINNATPASSFSISIETPLVVPYLSLTSFQATQSKRENHEKLLTFQDESTSKLFYIHSLLYYSFNYVKAYAEAL